MAAGPTVVSTDLTGAKSLRLNRSPPSLVKEIDRKQGVQSESAVLVGVELPDSEAARDNLDELAGLVETAGAEVVGRLTQRRTRPIRRRILARARSSSWS